MKDFAEKDVATNYLETLKNTSELEVSYLKNITIKIYLEIIILKNVQYVSFKDSNLVWGHPKRKKTKQNKAKQQYNESRAW